MKEECKAAGGGREVYYLNKRKKESSQSRDEEGESGPNYIVTVQVDESQ